MQAAGQALEEKSVQLAKTDEEVAQSKVAVEDTKEALSADQKFLVDLKERCASAEADYEQRKKTRADEVQAIAEAIVILTEDDARDLFSKTMSFLQLGAKRRGAGKLLGRGRQRLAGRTNMQQLRARAASQLLAVARRRGTAAGWRLATLAVGVQLDGFTKVKEMMDKMIAELKKQQGEEYEKHESCQKDIDANEDSTREKGSEKKDLSATITGLEGTLKGLEKDLEDLKTGIAEAHVALKTAGEQRKAENREFQQVVADQRATKAILMKALERLQAFYAKTPGAALLSVRAHGGRRQEPGAPVAPPPPTGKAYAPVGGAAGVLQMLEKVIQDAERADQEAVAAEQASQKAYGQLVSNINAELDTAATSITEKTAAKEQAEADKLIADKDLRATENAIAELADISKALHLECDYLNKNFDIRQQARQEEIEAIQEAKAILSGADFGTAS